jgi:hypothetical protein
MEAEFGLAVRNTVFAADAGSVQEDSEIPSETTASAAFRAMAATVFRFAPRSA